MILPDPVGLEHCDRVERVIEQYENDRGSCDELLLDDALVLRDLQVSPVVEEARDDRQPKENVPEDDRVNRKLLVDCVALGRERLT